MLRFWVPVLEWYGADDCASYAFSGISISVQEWDVTVYTHLLKRIGQIKAGKAIVGKFIRKTNQHFSKHRRLTLEDLL